MTQVIHADVDIALLDKADCLFRNDDAGVFVEVLQNARRAGATRVDISIEETIPPNDYRVVTVHDNGRGIEDFSVLLKLGKSKWSPATQESESPAGMGFYSLCHSDVEVRSGHRYVRLTPAVFKNQAEAIVQESEVFVPGTRLCFRRPSAKTVLVEALKRVTEFLPLEVCLEGEVLPSHDFLAGSLYRELINGVEVGFATQFEHGDNHHYDENWNFYGARIRHMPLEIRGLIRPGTAEVLTIRARFQVLETAVVRLQLPDRKAVVEDEGLAEFCRLAHAAAYRFFQTLPQHALPHRNWQEAKELGVWLPEASYLLTTWHACQQDGNSDGLFGLCETRLLPNVDNVILASRSLANAHTLEGALNSGAKLNWVIYQEEPVFAGYSWYEQLPVIVDAPIVVDGTPYEEWRHPSAARPAKIEVQLAIEQADQPDRTLTVQTPIHVDSERCNELDWLAIRNSPWDNDELQGPFDVKWFLMWATFSPSDDWEADSWETQRERYEEDVEREVNGYFRGPRATLLAILRSAIEWQATQFAEQLGVKEIRFTRTEHSWDVQLITADASSSNESQPLPQIC